MTTTQLALFIAGLILPTLYQRTKFALNRKSFETLSPSRAKSGLQIHHGHWGFLISFVMMYLVFFFDLRNSWTIGLSGLAYGLMLDEIVPMLLTKSPSREAELEVYTRSLKPTIIVIATVAVISLIVFTFL